MEASDNNSLVSRSEARKRRPSQGSEKRGEGADRAGWISSYIVPWTCEEGWVGRDERTRMDALAWAHSHGHTRMDCFINNESPFATWYKEHPREPVDVSTDRLRTTKPLAYACAEKKTDLCRDMDTNLLHNIVQMRLGDMRASALADADGARAMQRSLHPRTPVVRVVRAPSVVGRVVAPLAVRDEPVLRHAVH